MKKQEAICLKCGAWKQHSFSKCAKCCFEPKAGTQDEIKSVYLSTSRFENHKQKNDYLLELENLALALRKGESLCFDPNELVRLELQREAVRTVPYKSAWMAIFRLFLPGVLLLCGLAFVLYFLKHT